MWAFEVLTLVLANEDRKYFIILSSDFGAGIEDAYIEGTCMCSSCWLHSKNELFGIASSGAHNANNRDLGKTNLHFYKLSNHYQFRYETAIKTLANKMRFFTGCSYQLVLSMYQGSSHVQVR